MYDWMKKTLGSADSDMSNGVRFIAGATAGASSQSVLYPVEITKTRLMVGHYKSVKEVINFTWKNEGLSGFFKGYVPHTTGMLIFTGIDLTVYEMAKQQFIGFNTPQWILNMASAMCSSTFAHCTCYPISMLTTRLQVSSKYLS
ncbi:calcium-binding mitochondrial carrier protein SCaMC-2-A-like [Daktulosphaira vitifoliae]|uniref:calcium-binding mitochondrial carrier protein SCaMC-2-A-like n=1 Tax=Daktulosphaira vitifoliae TaxID=58002 RepID=UPI0021AA608B|nr:calcium-binding mitochondrial carrier protein SCaMC-2-A-like [Daktulosphaira vitifoliae]